MKCIPVFLLLAMFSIATQAQNLEQEQLLDSVVITSTRIDLPFSENSRTITVITKADIEKSAANNVADLLQQMAGIDIRRRGADGMQADLYIRGGGFDQTLLLIDGIKVEDAQTGHHTMNMALPLELIERVEVIKGPAARVFGQNAFTGAVNIVTKKNTQDQVSINAQAGSFGQLHGSVLVASQFENSSHIVQVSRNTSEGYRYNTDYDNQNYFIKSAFNTNHSPINLIASFQERKFGANGFYSNPSAINQYEETQASLVGVSTEIRNENLTLRPKIYWKRNQDIYVFIRENPAVYRNLHQTNKVGASLDASYTSKMGLTGFGVDIAKVYLSSNNLGSRNRFMTTLFLEHRFKLAQDKLDITPGVAVNYFSDFKFHAFPGLDIGYKLNEDLKIYGNIGYTYRIPTYTDLYYSDPTTLGNENLDPEEAIAEELGVKYNTGRFNASLAVFNRDSKKLIDYVKENEADLWEARNLRDLNTKGIELNTSYKFNIAGFKQQIKAGYTFLEDDLEEVNNFSKYAINSLKHHATAALQTQFIKNLSHNIIYKYAERASGESYAVVDASVNYTMKSLELSVTANNIFNTEYTETNLVPMPKGNVLFGVKYLFK
ncbi:iron complex outermembrane receptor protein [Oceanihabitans sediminis]|uniref:TonB-dependent receptor n=1 Tax=Oceanihabitans sediminis TaxID=1812012 RepID=A0A368P6F8_9FLAO|nr:TonB-dependent receptor [Oceanihabitans sediminis]MDX1364941.1 TonB-dependent receptor [Arenibacter latericius]RBP34822.1 iron complex outermembrane receptor protein [Oceanihabitans sediminis]RCU58467.1 TonB-dependent receptor [Oceanihabitans sediminis]